ncbi:alpha/beta hydrolase [Zunongwangia sp. HRR-M8]|uniref:alpha/beta hydrolase n=1 Tax=Zunongwangia sp. HRR-M8 TaxID=3015170 RepID=UPI0022DE6C90|nr:alpha/beta hydrolase [Zunongwangia sp. HRR-M8]WBL23346.1 alpha/beta hydrolase [Zunongwangia sp. HRR-M8]
MKKSILFCVLLWISLKIDAQEYINLWPEGSMPNSKGMSLDHQEERQRITQVKTPGMYAFFPPPEERNGTSVVIFPGGGYHHLTYDLGGFQLAKWFNTQGITAFVLIYRLPTSPDLKSRQQGPIQDAQRALKIIRHRAIEWSLDVDKVGLMGSSAGGHLAATLGTHFTDYSQIDDTLDTIDFKADFMILVSPVISLGDYTHQGSRENFLGTKPNDSLIRAYSNQFHVSKQTPPTFLVHAANDSAVSPINSMMFYQEMLKNKIPGSMHIFPKGGHAIGMYNASKLTDQWKELCTIWLSEMELIP